MATLGTQQGTTQNKHLPISRPTLIRFYRILCLHVALEYIEGYRKICIAKEGTWTKMRNFCSEKNDSGDDKVSGERATRRRAAAEIHQSTNCSTLSNIHREHKRRADDKSQSAEEINARIKWKLCVQRAPPFPWDTIFLSSLHQEKTVEFLRGYFY